MKRKPSSRGLLAGALLACLVGSLLNPFLPTVQAESPAQITILGVDTSSFPANSIWFTAKDANGAIIPNLSAGDLQVVENGKTLPVKALSLEDPGIRLTVAFNPGPGFALYAAGATRFESIQKSLIDSAANLTAPADDYTLITSNGILTARNPDPKQWVSLLEQFKPNLTKPAVGLSSLTQAVDLTADTDPREHMQQVVLFITPMPSAEQLKLIPNITQRALQMGVRIFIWLVGPSFAGSSLETQNLRSLADATGGDLFVFSGVEKLPSLSSYLNPLRGIYRLEYTSQINESGQNTLAIQHATNGLESVSGEFPLQMTVQPPNPVFLNPPQTITRSLTWVENQKKNLLIPLNQPIIITVEFPDGHTRPLASSRLYVDGKLAVENQMEPFNQFIWDLAPYLQKDTHTLRVEVTDTLGLSSSTISIPVEVDIQNQPSLFSPDNLDRLAILFAILLAGAALVLVLIFMGRRGWSAESRRKKRKEYLDPVTQPVEIRQEHSLTRRPSIAGAQGDDQSDSGACLILQGEGSPARIPLNDDDITLGSDRKQASVFLDSSSIDPLHARITCDAEGVMYIRDLGSVAGTWVNYTPISATGVRLENGDLIQIGKMSFRFQSPQGS